MAVPVVQSVGSVSFSSTTSVVIPKPSGLAEGDLMLAAVTGGATISSPGSWTEALAEANVNDGNPEYLHCFYKVADAGDVAASNFTFSVGSATESAGAILRITGQRPSSVINATASGTQVDGNPNFSGLTTTQPNCLLVMAVAGVFVNSGTSGYAIANSNPTWTEQFDDFTSGDDNHTLAIATGSFATEGATGNYSATLNSVAETDSVAQLIAIGGTADATVTPAAVALSAAIPVFAVSVGVTLAMSALGVTTAIPTPTVATQTYPAFSNTAKNSASPSNTSKNAASPSNVSKNSVTFTNTDKTV